MSRGTPVGVKTALVTGASTGIGRMTAIRLAERGYQVYGTSRSGAPVDAAFAMVRLDVRQDASVAACVAEVLDRTGRIDVLVNNAGYLVAGSVEEVPFDEARAQLETNFFGVARMIRAVLPTMREQRSGRIVTVSSLAGLVPVPFWGYYNASKFAVEGLCETLRFEVAPFGIHVSLVEPGAIKTPFYEAPAPAGASAYSPWRERLLRTMAGFERDAPGPELVADTVDRIVASARPRLRWTVTREARLFTFLRWLLPSRLNELGTRQGFNLDRAGFEAG